MPLNQTNQQGNHTIPLEETTRPQCVKVFIQRDYTEGTAVKFQTGFPSELEDKIDKKKFQDTINQLNTYFEEAEQSACSTYCEGCLACITAYLIFICSQTHYEKCLKKVAKFIADQNQNVYEPANLHITDPIERGLRVIEITTLGVPSVSRT